MQQPAHPQGHREQHRAAVNTGHGGLWMCRPHMCRQTPDPRAQTDARAARQSGPVQVSKVPSLLTCIVIALCLDYHLHMQSKAAKVEPARFLGAGFCMNGPLCKLHCLSKPSWMQPAKHPPCPAPGLPRTRLSRLVPTAEGGC